MFEFGFKKYDDGEYRSWAEVPTWAKACLVVGLLMGLIALILVATGIIDNNQVIFGIHFKVVEINLIEF